MLEFLKVLQWLFDAVDVHECRCNYTIIRLAPNLEKQKAACSALGWVQAEVVAHDRGRPGAWGKGLVRCGGQERIFRFPSWSEEPFVRNL